MIREAVDAAIKAILSEKDYLSQLDEKTGDGDHGLNMARGAQAAQEAMDELDEPEDLKKVLSAIGEAFATNVGGTAGPLYGAGLLAAAEVVDENATPDIPTLEKIFGAAVEEIKKRGHADKGDKTMLDVLIPIHECFVAGNVSGESFEEVLAQARDAARDGVNYTKDIPARRGLASHLGEKSIGFEDPGAMSSFIIFRTLCSFRKS